MTTQWACFTIAGPKARELLSGLDPDFDLSADALPHMSLATGQLAGLPVRLLRVSFSGEASFEISVPARHGPGLLETLLDAGKPLGVTPYGVEALMLLRLEKGYIHVGSDTDGETTPDDIGWGRVARAKDRDFVGRRSLFRPANQAAGRKQLVGLRTVEISQPLRPGGHLLPAGLGKNNGTTHGWITSAGYSPHLQRHIALAMLTGGRDRTGERLQVHDGDERFEVEVVAPVFFDPENERLHV